jgi:hypothetical protein
MLLKQGYQLLFEGSLLVFRTFGAPNYSAYLIHALTGVATNFRPFGPQLPTAH